MKNVLIITYYWPPSGGAGVQRWLKFAKYLPEHGWNPIIFTSKDGEYPSIDPSLEKDVPESTEVLRLPIWEPYSFYKNLLGQKKSEKINSGFLSENKKPKLTEKLSVWIRGNFFIPDARKFWIKPSVKFIMNYLKDHHVDAIVSTGPPHTVHLIAREIKRQTSIPWLADFRDAWTGIDYYDKLMLTSWADKKHRSQESSVLAEASLITSIGKGCSEDLAEKGNINVLEILNGFDSADFQGVNVKLSDNFTVSHVGSLNKDRNPTCLWDALSELCEEVDGFRDDFRLRLIGKVDVHALADLKDHGLKINVEQIEYMPHDEMVTDMCGSQVLLLLINETPNQKGIVTGKIFEYIASKRPIIVIGPEDGDAAHIVNSAGSGTTIDFKDVAKMKTEVLGLYKKFKSGEDMSTSSDISRYTREFGAKKVAEALSSLTA